MTYFHHRFERTALAALRQWPIRNSRAIQGRLANLLTGPFLMKKQAEA
jgi:hypothetical protein